MPFWQNFVKKLFIYNKTLYIMQQYGCFGLHTWGMLKVIFKTPSAHFKSLKFFLHFDFGFN